MSNEEKILEMLTQMRTDIPDLQNHVKNIVLPHIQLPAEGHTTIQEQIKKLSVIDSMQDDIAILKAAFRFLSQRMEEIEKAI